MANERNFTCSMSHVGVRVSDLEKSTRFYCEGFGFEKFADVPMGNEAAKLSGNKEFASYMRILKSPHTGALIELISQTVPTPNWVRPDGTAFGLYHLSFAVSDLDQGLQRIEKFGGTVFSHRVGSMEIPGMGTMKIGFGADPDGQVIELVAHG